MATKMEGNPAVAEKLYRLRLVLPDLSQSFAGNWLASLEKSIPPELFHDFDDLFDAPEKKSCWSGDVSGSTSRSSGGIPSFALAESFVGRILKVLFVSLSAQCHFDRHFLASGRSGDVYASRRNRTGTQSRRQISARENADSNDTIRQTTNSGKSHELWLHAGELAPCGPEVHTWEVCHGLENWLLEKASESSREIISLPLTNVRGSSLSEFKIEDGKPHAVLPLSSNSAPGSVSTIVPESELVRDALYALQGLPAAVRKLERLSRVYCASPADKGAHKLSTLWTRSVTASALGKVLSVVARAGHVRCQLNAFVSFFLDNRVDPYEEKTDNAPKVSRKASKNKKRAATLIKETEKHTINESGSENTAMSSEKKVPRHCLVNQAFAAAVKGILRGHSAALNTLASSVSLRRDQEMGVSFTDGASEEQDPGPVIGYGNRDISLLEFYLHTRELRVQLHALAFICLMREGRSFVGRTVSDAYLEEDLMDTKDNELELDSINGRKSGSKDDGKCDPLVQSFEKFPRGADLLTYLYDRLMEVDPLHMELLRFLFERAYEPYSIFVQSWLYQAAVRDPYGEFIIEQADFSVVSSSSKPKGKLVADPHPRDLKLRSGLYVPRFMENICTPLIRAGEQLQVLLKLAETCELAQQMANKARTSELFWPQSSTESLMESTENSPYLPALVFSKKKLEENAEERERKSQELSDKFDILFTDLASRRSMERSKASSRSDTPTILSLVVNNDEIEDKEVLLRDPEPRLNTCQELPLNIPGAREDQERRITEVTVTLPKRGWVTSAEDEQPADDSFCQLEGKSRGLWQVGSKNDPASLDVKEMQQTEKPLTSRVSADALGLTLEPRDPSALWFDTDSTRVTKGVKTGNGSSKLQTLVSSYQRGTSWQIWGLPQNPFLVQADAEDSAPTAYVYPGFIGTYQHWDVTAKPTSASTTVNHTFFLENSRGSPKYGRESNIEPSWFARLEAALNDQVFAGLDAQLSLPSWGQAEIGSAGDEAGQWGLIEFHDQLPIQIDLKAPDPLGLPPEDHSGSDALASSPLNSSPIVHLKSSVPAELAPTQALTAPPNLMLDLQSEIETLTDIKSPRSRHAEESLAQGSLADLESLERSDALCPLHLAFNVGKDPAENCLTEPYSSHDETEESDWVKVTGVKEEPGIPQLLKASDTARWVTTMGSNVSNLDEGKVSQSSEQINCLSSRNSKVHCPANWVQHMSDAVSPGAIEDANDDSDHDDDADEMPLSVVVSKCIAEEILSQYQSVSTLTVRLFQEGLCLQDHYRALRRYYFMERGDWAEYFTTALCEHRWGPLGSQLRQMEVQGMLEVAFQKSSCEGDAYAERVHVTFQESGYCCENSIHGSNKTSTSYVDPSRLDAFDFITLQYRVDWPLSLILTNQSLSSYDVVFTFLMRIKLTVHALGDIWQRLQLIDRSLRKERASLSSQQQRNRFRTLQQFRQQIYHIVVTLQRYVESKLVNVVWSKFLQDLELEVNDMQDLEFVHRTYLEEAAEECFLSTKTRGVKGCIDSIMQCVLDFSAHMRNAYWSSEKLDLIDDNLFMQVHQVKKGFQASLQQLHNYHMNYEGPVDQMTIYTLKDAVHLHQARSLPVTVSLELACTGHRIHVRLEQELKECFSRVSRKAKGGAIQELAFAVGNSFHESRVFE